jgi:hypothetical protein
VAAACDVGVVEDDGGGLAAEFEGEAGDAFTTDRGDARPAAVEPVKVILSTRGSRTSSSETSRSAVTR